MSPESDELDFSKGNPADQVNFPEHDLESTEEEAAAGPPAGEEETVDETPSEPSGPDLSFLDADLQEKLKSEVPPDVLELFAKHGKGYMLRDKDYRQKTMALADERREVKAMQTAAENWEKLSGDRDAIKLVEDYWERGSKPVEEEVDIYALPPEEFEAHLEKKMRRIAEQAREEAIQAVQGPQQHNLALGQAAENWMNTNGKDQDVVAEATRMIVERNNVSDLTPDRLASLLPDYVELVESRGALTVRQQTQEANSQKAARARTASPRGGSGNLSTSGDLVDDAIAAKQKRLGRKLTTEEAGEIIFSHLQQVSGKSERDLDRERELMG